MDYESRGPSHGAPHAGAHGRDHARVAAAAAAPGGRAAVLRRFFDLMMENQHDLGVILTAEQGKPLPEARLPTRLIVRGSTVAG